MRFDYFKIPLFLIIITGLFFLLGTAAFAEDDVSDTDDLKDEIQMEDTGGDEDVVDEDIDDDDGDDDEGDDDEPEDLIVADPEYLDESDNSDLDFSLVLKLTESGEDSFFFRRYHDPYVDDSVYVRNIDYRGWITGDEIVWFNLANSWTSGVNAEIEWLRPGDVWAWARFYDFDFFEIPSTSMASRREFAGGFDIPTDSSGTFGLDYNFTEYGVQLVGDSGATPDWESSQMNFYYRFDMNGWNGTVEYDTRHFEDMRSDAGDIDYNTGSFRIGRTFGDSTYIEGNVLYNVAEVHNNEDLETFHVGGYGRFVDALGTDGFNIITRINYDDRNDGPSNLHPAGDSFNFDLEGQWRPSDDIYFYGAYEYDKTEYTHADQYTNFMYFQDNDRPDNPLNVFFEDTIRTNHWNFGGRWEMSDDFDFSVDLDWTNRDDLPMTDYGGTGFPTLWWESESDYTFTFRYNPGSGYGISSGDWLLKYETQERENGLRGSTSGVDRFSINWTGMVTPEVYLYLGGGMFKSDNTHPILGSFDQDGQEYGVGWAWMLGDNWDFYGDYWTYNVDGAWGYDQTSFLAGLGYEPDENWRWALEYDRIEGDFDNITALDYEVEDLLLEVSYRW